MLIQAGANVKADTRLGDFTPLFMAAKNGNAAMIDLLRESRCRRERSQSAPEPRHSCWQPLRARLDAVKVLLERGANVNARDTVNGQTALMFAAAVNAGPAIKLLAANRADLNAVSKVLEPRDPE